MSRSIPDNKKSKRGRPKTTGSGELIGVRYHPPRLAELDDWRRNQQDLPSRAEAIRRLVDIGLATDKKGGRK